MLYNFFYIGYGDHRHLHVLTHSFPTRRASDLQDPPVGPRPDPLTAAPKPDLLEERDLLVVARCGFVPDAPLLRCRRLARLGSCSTHCLEIGRAHVCTPVTNAHHVCRLLLEKKTQQRNKHYIPQSLTTTH